MRRELPVALKGGDAEETATSGQTRCASTGEGLSSMQRERMASVRLPLKVLGTTAIMICKQASSGKLLSFLLTQFAICTSSKTELPNLFSSSLLIDAKDVT